MAEKERQDEFAIDMGDMADRRGDKFDALPPRSVPSSPSTSSSIVSPANAGLASIFAYCGSSILMTTTNKYVLSGLDYNLNFLLLAVQVR